VTSLEYISRYYLYIVGIQTSSVKYSRFEIVAI
jgi:hypothetical protein